MGEKRSGSSIKLFSVRPLPAPKVAVSSRQTQCGGERELAGWLIQIIRSYAFKRWQPLLQRVPQTSLNLIWHLTFYVGRQLPLWGEAKFSAEEVKPARQCDPGSILPSAVISRIVLFFSPSWTRQYFRINAVHTLGMKRRTEEHQPICSKDFKSPSTFSCFERTRFPTSGQRAKDHF